MRDDDRIYPPGVVPAFAAIVGLLVGLALLSAVLITRCERSEPTQMIPTPAPVTISTATSSAEVTASQSVRVTIRRPPGGAGGSSARPITTAAAESTGENVPNWGQGEEIVIEMTQAAGATSTAAASASVAANSPTISESSHGRLGVLALTAPGILAADWQIGSVTIPAWAVGVPLEVGLDLEGNLEHGGLGLSVGSKAFAYVGAWSQWNLSAQGVGVGAGLRF